MRRPALPVLLALAAALCFGPAAAQAAAPPQLGALWTTEVSAGSATFNGEVNPEGSSTTCRFEYATDAAFKEKGFTGAALATCEPSPGSGSAFVTVAKHVSALKANTTYHYRLSVTGEGTTTSSPQTFTTQEIGAAFKLPDARGWELVSPPDKNGGAIQGFEANHGGGVLQAAAAGPGAITYTSASSFGGYEAQGAPQGSQYISRRGPGASGWSTENITTPTLSGAYGNDPNGVPYQLFSGDLARGLMLNGVHCRGEGTGCPVANPPLPGAGAPAGYQNYYLRDNEGGGFTAVLTEANAELALTSSQFNLAFAGASPDLRHVILSTCAALTPGATEVGGTEGCDPTKANLYQWSGGVLSLINVDPGAELAAQGGAVSADGSRVYFTEEGKLWLREGVPAPHELASGAEFQTATPSGAIAFFTKGEHLFRYDAAGHSATDLTPAGAVIGVLGASEDGSRVYYATAAGGLFLWNAGATTTVSAVPGAAQASDYPPTTATARVSADGTRLLFLSKSSLTGYDNTDASTGLPDSEVFLYNAGILICVSCNPTNERPLGPSTIPGASSNGKAPGSTATYKPRALSATANRVFFDSSDALVALDTNKASDAYQWEAQGTGSCQRAGGCLSLLSSGSDGQGASFIDASESGEDAYFLTSSSLVPADPGSADVYDARSEGGFPAPTSPIPCEGDACQPLPSPPEDPTVGSLIPGPGNPPIHFPKVHKPKKGHHKGKQHHKHSHRHHRRAS